MQVKPVVDEKYVIEMVSMMRTKDVDVVTVVHKTITVLMGLSVSMMPSRLPTAHVRDLHGHSRVVRCVENSVVTNRAKHFSSVLMKTVTTFNTEMKYLALMEQTSMEQVIV